MIIILFIRFVY